MKILIVTHYFLPHKGGVEFVVYNQSKELAKKGHDVTVISSKIGDEPEEEFIEDVRIKRIPIWNWFEKKWGVPYPVYKPKIVTKFYKEIKNSDIVYIHDIFYMPCYFAAFFANLHRKPIVLMEHINNVDHEKWIVNFVQKTVMKTLGKYVLNSSKKVILCNSKVGEWIKDKFKKDCSCIFIKNSVNTDLFKPTTKKGKIELRKKHKLPLNKPIVLFVGRLYEVKGFDRLFNARDKKYLTLFVGSGIVPEEMKKAKDVKFIGAVSQEELAEFYQLSDMFCLPSRNEGFPLSILEALSCGIPVVSSKLPGYEKYLNKKDAILIDASKTQNIKDAIFKIINNKKAYEDLKQYYRNKAVKEFDWKVNVNRLEKVFKEVLRENEKSKFKRKDKKFI